ncbi:hydrolase [Kibdelosporangium aridum]|uniref:Hydrolase n=1 Tax=Kibdelosporangium aridum TaxID=2030 RepID=A0A428YCH1_KIBAR|nr:amidohydrolase family protein [Kibdelosporangium aridum]RSM65249.1 hydrolase [Kibdelosporangium aridum]
MRIFDFHARLAPRPGAVDRLLDVLDRSGIERAVICAGGTIPLDTLSRQLVEGGHVETDADNDVVFLAGESSGGRLVPCYFANPHRGTKPYLADGKDFHGLEISPAVHGIPLTDDRVAELVDIAGEFGHSVYTVCIDRPGCGVADLAALARRFPAVPFVMGHCGIGNIDYHGIELVAAVPNVHVETSGGYSTVARAAIDRLGPARVLFGSEYPLQHPLVELAKLEVLDLSADQWHQIAWANADRLTGKESR